jgi:hypothetical protein
MNLHDTYQASVRNLSGEDRAHELHPLCRMDWGFTLVTIAAVIAGAGCSASSKTIPREQCELDKTVLVQSKCQDQQRRCVIFARAAFARYCRGYQAACEETCRVSSNNEDECNRCIEQSRGECRLIRTQDLDACKHEFNACLRGESAPVALEPEELPWRKKLDAGSP